MSAALDRLVDDLRREFQRDARAPGATKLLASYARTHEDWRPWAQFSAERYTRHQVDRTSEFELLILCWGVGHQSPIHNHEGQNCWMAVLDGDIDELQYEWSPGRAPVLTRELCFTRSEVAFIRDEIGLHVVRSKPRTTAISLHLYARPYDACNVYCERTGAVTRKQLSYDSIRGESASLAREQR